MSAARKRTHGKYGTPEYKCWKGAKQRCFYSKDKTFKNYGGRGITMCREWRFDFEKFLEHIGPKPPGMSLDRINVNGNYEPGNVRWASGLTQANNCRTNRILTVNGMSETVSEWGRKTGFGMTTIHHRLERGFSAFDAITKPKRIVSKGQAESFQECSDSVKRMVGLLPP